MAKIKKVKASDVGAALANTLTIYSEEVQEGLHKVTKDSMDELVKLTKASAPVGPTGELKRRITSTEVKLSRGVRYVWHVKAPDHRIIHLVVHGHEKANGDRTKSNPFLKNALDQVLPKFEAEVERIIQEGGAGE